LTNKKLCDKILKDIDPIKLKRRWKTMTGQSDGNRCSAACSVQSADPDPHLCKRLYAYLNEAFFSALI